MCIYTHVIGCGKEQDRIQQLLKSETLMPSSGSSKELVQRKINLMALFVHRTQKHQQGDGFLGDGVRASLAS